MIWVLRMQAFTKIFNSASFLKEEIFFKAMQPWKICMEVSLAGGMQKANENAVCIELTCKLANAFHV